MLCFFNFDAPENFRSCAVIGSTGNSNKRLAMAMANKSLFLLILVDSCAEHYLFLINMDETAGTVLVVLQSESYERAKNDYSSSSTWYKYWSRTETRL